MSAPLSQENHGRWVKHQHRFSRLSHGATVEMIRKVKFLIPILLHATLDTHTILSYHNFFARESQEEIRGY